jgi:hypothetical protein
LAYVIVDKIGIRLLRDPFTDKPNVLFYAYRRVGGSVANSEAVKVELRPLSEVPALLFPGGGGLGVAAVPGGGTSRPANNVD